MEPFIFISYSRANLEQVEAVRRAMEARGYRTWMDKDINGGHPWTKEIAEHIDECAVFMPFLSSTFFESDNCLQEVRHAKKKTMIPVWLGERTKMPPEFAFLLNCAEELSLPDYPDADAFAAHLDDEPHCRPCRGASAEGDGAAVRRASVVTVNPPAGPSPSFVGREDRMEEIEQAFRHNAAVVDLYGMGGIGKSEICRKLFQKYTDEGTDLAKEIGWVTWQGTPRETFYAQFRGIDETNAERYWERARDYMRQQGRDLLIFLDNADTLADASELTRLGCRFLVTSRGKPDSARTIAAGVLPPEQRRVLYRRALYDDDTLTDDTPEETLDKILDLTAGHALTIKLLAKTQLAAQLTAEELLDQLKESGFDLTGIPEEIYYNHRKEQDETSETYGKFIQHMARVFDLSTLRKDARDAAALRALQGMSLLAPNVYIAMRTAQKWLGLPDLNGLNRAAALGWLNQRTEKGGLRSVSIHPVVAAVVHRTEPPGAELVDAVAGELRLDMIPGTTEVFTTRLPIVEHAAALDQVASEMDLQTENYGKMLGMMGYLLYYQADYDRSLSYQLRGVKIEETVLGTNHRETATTYNNIATVYRAQGDYARALELHQKALDIREKVLGTDHPSTAITYNNIAGVYLEQGNYARALEWHQKALEIREKVLEADHPDTATTYHNIGHVYEKQGDYARALEWYQKALNIREKVLGTDHPDTATTYHNIGTNYFRQGDYREALNWFKKAQKINIHILGTEHPHTKITQEWIDAAKQHLSGDEQEGAGE